MVAFYTISSLLLAGMSAFCYKINAICYLSCYLPAHKIQQRCDKSTSYFLLFSTTEKSAFTLGGHSSTGSYFYVLLTWAAIQTGSYQSRVVKRAYTVGITDVTVVHLWLNI